MDDQKITILKGPDRVRRRPTVVFLSDGIEGVQCAVHSIIKIFATEAQQQRCAWLKVVHSGTQLEFSGDDRGFYLGQDTDSDDVWQNLFCQLYAAAAFAPTTSEAALDLTDDPNGFYYGKQPADEYRSLEMYAFQCVCKYLEVISVRDGYESTLRFEKGYNIGGLQKKPSAAPCGTTFRFEPDPEVFTETQLPEAYFREMLEAFALLIPGFHCTYINGAGEATDYVYPKGMTDYIGQHSSEPVYHSNMWAKGRERYNSAEYTAYLEVAVGFTPNAGLVRCYHNLEELPCGGTHMEQLQKRLHEVFDLCCRKELTGLTSGELAKHLTVILATRCAPAVTAWVNGTRKSIKNRLITDMAQDAIDEAFENGLYQNKTLCQSLVKAVLTDRKGEKKK